MGEGVTPPKQIGVDSGQDLSRESHTEAIVEHDGGQGIVVIADSNGDGGWCTGCLWRRSRKDRDDKGNTDASKAGGSGKYNGEMAMIVAASGFGTERALLKSWCY